MPEIAKSGQPSYCSTNPSSDQFPAYKAGAEIQAADCCYVGPDGLAYPALAGNAAPGNRVRGQAAGYAPINGSVTLTRGLRFRYGQGLTPGQDLFLSGTAPGGLADAAASALPPVAFAVDATRVEFFYAR